MSDREKIKCRLENRLGEKNAEYRKRVLDIAEEHLSCSENWKVIRSRLLRLFGNRGFGHDIQQILNNEFIRGNNE